jgi:hypothetical protein
MRWLGDEDIGSDTYHNYELSTGKRFYANSGILGLGPDDGPDDNPAQGYDGHVHVYTENYQHMVPLTADEKREIAEEMIARWKRWGELA